MQLKGRLFQLWDSYEQEEMSVSRLLKECVKKSVQNCSFNLLTMSLFHILSIILSWINRPIIFSLYFKSFQNAFSMPNV